MEPLNETKKSKSKTEKSKRPNGDGSVYYANRPNGRKVLKAAILDINGVRRTKTFKRRADAEEWLPNCLEEAFLQWKTSFGTNF